MKEGKKTVQGGMRWRDLAPQPRALTAPNNRDAPHLDESLHKIRLAIRPEWEWISKWWYAERRVPIHVAR